VANLQQAVDLGGHVNRGEHGLTVLFYRRVAESDTGDDAEQDSLEASNVRWRSCSGPSPSSTRRSAQA